MIEHIDSTSIHRRVRLQRTPSGRSIGAAVMIGRTKANNNQLAFNAHKPFEYVTDSHKPVDQKFEFIQAAHISSLTERTYQNLYISMTMII